MAVPNTRLRVAPQLRAIDHVTLPVRDYRLAKRFYELALRPLGFSVLLDWPDRGRAYLGLPSETSSLWLVQDGTPGRVALSLVAPDRSSVDGFYTAAVAAGGRPVAQPAFRPEYTPFTYAAQVLDADGNSLEAICRHADPAATAVEHAA